MTDTVHIADAVAQIDERRMRAIQATLHARTGHEHRPRATVVRAAGAILLHAASELGEHEHDRSTSDLG